MIYFLEKISIKDGHRSSVGVGRKIRGDTFKVVRVSQEGTREIKSLEKPSEIQRLDEVVVSRSIFDFIKTSPVETVEKINEISWKLTTETSVYILRLERDEEDLHGDENMVHFRYPFWTQEYNYV